MSLARHRDNHLAARVAAVAAHHAAEDTEHARSIVERLHALADAAERAAYAAIAAGSGNAPSAVREARETLVRVGELTGELNQSPVERTASLLEQLVDGRAESDPSSDDPAR